MRPSLILVGIALLVFVGYFAYPLWIRPIDQPTRQLLGLEAHFNAHGIPGHLYAVKHTFSHTKIKAAGAYEIKDYPLPVSLLSCTTEAEAIARSAHDPNYPEALQPIRNGVLVLSFIMWGDDTYDMAQSVKNAFQSYRAEP